jgi:hypothetical protein
MRAPGTWTDLSQTEQAEYRLGGLILTIEGVGKSKPEGKPVLQAFGIISYDDDKGTYWMRAFNDGRFVETEVKLLDTGLGVTWGFTAGKIRTSSVLRINQDGEWTEATEIIMGSQTPAKFMEVTVRRER